MYTSRCGPYTTTQPVYLSCNTTLTHHTHTHEETERASGALAAIIITHTSHTHTKKRSGQVAQSMYHSAHVSRHSAHISRAQRVDHTPASGCIARPARLPARLPRVSQDSLLFDPSAERRSQTHTLSSQNRIPGHAPRHGASSRAQPGPPVKPAGDKKESCRPQVFACSLRARFFAIPSPFAHCESLWTRGEPTRHTHTQRRRGRAVVQCPSDAHTQRRRGRAVLPCTLFFDRVCGRSYRLH